MTMNNVYHETCIQNVHEGIVKTEGRMKTCIGIISLAIGEELYLYREHTLPPISIRS